ncbi:glycosyltransferase family 4 protein [bacterium]|nr:glycosyltransferase family 4 protein [bacterium]
MRIKKSEKVNPRPHIAFLEFTGQGGIHQYSAKYVDELSKAGIPSILITSKKSEMHLKYGKKYEIEPYSGMMKIAFYVKKLLKRNRKPATQKGINNVKTGNHNSLRGVKSLWKKILNILKKERINVLHIQWLWDYYPEQFYYLEKIRKMGIKIFFTFHNWAPHSGINAYIVDFYEKLDEHIDNFFTHSDYDKVMIERNYKIKSNKVHLMKMGNVLEFKDIKKDRNPYLTLLFFGYIRPYKGLEEFLSFYNNNNFDLHLKIVGNIEKDRKSVIEKLVNNSKNKDKISLKLGYVPNEDIPNIFRDIDFLILPYKEATQSALISLSYSLHTPVIVYDVGGLSQNVKNSETGFIIKTPFKENFKDLFSNNLIEKRELLSNNAYEYYRNDMSWPAILEKYKNFLDLKF